MIGHIDTPNDIWVGQLWGLWGSEPGQENAVRVTVVDIHLGRVETLDPTLGVIAAGSLEQFLATHHRIAEAHDDRSREPVPNRAPVRSETELVGAR